MASSSRLNRRFDPLKIRTNLVFIILATLFIAFTAWLMQGQFIPSMAETDFSRRYSPWSTFLPIKLWMQLAVVFGLLLPIFALAACWGKSPLRSMLLLYIAILFIQIVTESTFSRLGFTGMNYVVGFVYTSYRLWQLYRYNAYISGLEKLARRKQIVQTVFVMGIIFWGLNLLILAINLVTRSLAYSFQG